jgi:hypothetical protein
MRLYVFTEQGVAMLSGVLKSKVFKTLRHLIAPPVRPKRAIGFRVPEDE